MSDKTVAERLRECAEHSYPSTCTMMLDALWSTYACPKGTCDECRKKMLNTLADMIEAEQAERPHEVDVDVDVDVLPDDVIWPRFEDGELVRFGDVFTDKNGKSGPANNIEFYEGRTIVWSVGNESGIVVKSVFEDGLIKRPEPEVLDADGVPIKVGDTVWYISGGNAKTVKRIVDGFVEVEESIARLFPEQLTHRKPDTFESVVAEMLADFDSNDSIEVDGYFSRLRKLLGGE